jgi:hypothetical protein
VAAYRFAVTVRLDPEGVTVEPATFETTVRWPAPEPGTEGWLFFRDTLWHGEISDPEPFRERLAELLGVPVRVADFRAFECTSAERSALKEAIADTPEAFRSDDPERVVQDYFGSSLEVTENT